MDVCAHFSVLMPSLMGLQKMVTGIFAAVGNLFREQNNCWFLLTTRLNCFVPEYSSASIANYFIRKAAESGDSLTPMKLLKLVYIAHGWHLGLTGAPLISDPIEAWQYGPVISRLYHEYKIFGGGKIPATATSPLGTRISSETGKLLDTVWNAYARYNGAQLSTLTHQKGTPWDQVYNEQAGSLKYGAVIPNDLIEAHYRTKSNA